jgi:protein TonB
MIKKSSTFISGFLAFGIYFTLIGLLIFYFNTRDEKKSVHYVKKDEKRIQVALSTPKKPENKKAINPKPKIKPKPKPKVKPKVKKKVESKPKVKPKPKPKKVVKKKVTKEKVVKKIVKKKDENLTKPKKKTLDLFANVKIPKKKNIIKVSDKPIKTTPKNNLIKVTDKPMSASERISTSLKNQKSSDSGVENAYLAKVQSMLEGWPAQSEYVGEKVKVLLLIDPTGGFEFKLKTASNNENFNTGLIEYLEQLQTIGFGRHKGARTYKFEAEFIAKE